MKKCRKCKIEKKISEFYKEKGGKDNLRSACKSCRKEELEIWRKNKKNNPDSYLRYKEKVRLSYILRTFGCTEAQYNEMFILQKGCCSICKTPQEVLKKSLAVDHCHVTGVVRGLLCTNCNTALGLLKENIDVINNMIFYLNSLNKKNET